MPALLVTVPTVTQILLHPLSTSSIIAHHLLDFMVQGKITVPTICLDATRSGLHSVPPPPSPIFTWNAFSVAIILPYYPGLGTGTNLQKNLTICHNKFIVRSAYDSDLKCAKICLSNTVSQFTLSRTIWRLCTFSRFLALCKFVCIYVCKYVSEKSLVFFVRCFVN